MNIIINIYGQQRNLNITEKTLKQIVNKNDNFYIFFRSHSGNDHFFRFSPFFWNFLRQYLTNKLQKNKYFQK